MLAALIAVASLALDTPKEEDCTALARAECVTLMGALFRSADPITGQAVRVRQEPNNSCPRSAAFETPPCVSRWIAIPRFLVTVQSQRVLIVQNDHEGGGPHFEPGSWSAYYFDATNARLLRAHRDFLQSGSFGYAGAANLVFVEDTPTLFVAAGGTWQGHSCTWASISLLTSTGPRLLLAPFLLDYDCSGSYCETPISAEIETITLSSAVVIYDNGQRFTFRRRGSGPMRPDAEMPRRC